MRAKCGRIVVHHWAHEIGVDCDNWFEPETEWHRNWKLEFPMDTVEVPVGDHRADVRIQELVVELQNSAISPAEIQARELHYGRMIWIVNAEKFAERFYLLRQMNPHVLSFRWKRMKSSWRFARRPVYFDFGRVRIKELLGATVTDSTVFYTVIGDEPSTGTTHLTRYDGPATTEKQARGYRAEEAFERLSSEIVTCSVLRLTSLHANGYGSAAPVGRRALIEWCHKP